MWIEYFSLFKEGYLKLHIQSLKVNNFNQKYKVNSYNILLFLKMQYNLSNLQNAKKKTSICAFQSCKVYDKHDLLDAKML